MSPTQKKHFRPDIVKSGGRSGENVVHLQGPPNSYIRGEGNHVFETDEAGWIIRDIDPERVKVREANTAPNGQVFYRMVKLEGRPGADDVAILRGMGITV